MASETTHVIIERCSKRIDDSRYSCRFVAGHNGPCDLHISAISLPTQPAPLTSDDVSGTRNEPASLDALTARARERHQRGETRPPINEAFRIADLECEIDRLLDDRAALTRETSLLRQQLSEAQATSQQMAMWLTARDHHTYFCGQGDAGDNGPCSCGYAAIFAVATDVRTLAPTPTSVPASSRLGDEPTVNHAE